MVIIGDPGFEGSNIVFFVAGIVLNPEDTGTDQFRPVMTHPHSVSE